MIVVAIVGLLAAIAIPSFLEMQLRAKRAEIPANLNGIKTAEMAYEASYNAFISAAPNPTLPPGKVAQAWVATSPYAHLNWAPDGHVRGSYTITTIPASGGGAGDFIATATADIDGDGVPCNYTATRSINAKQNTGNDTY